MALMGTASKIGTKIVDLGWCSPKSMTKSRVRSIPLPHHRNPLILVGFTMVRTCLSFLVVLVRGLRCS
jgi:hypothetical protein